MRLFGLIALLLGLAAAGFAARTALTAQRSDTTASQPRDQLDRVRARAHELEREQQRRADEAASAPEQ